MSLYFCWNRPRLSLTIDPSYQTLNLESLLLCGTLSKIGGIVRRRAVATIQQKLLTAHLTTDRDLCRCYQSDYLNTWEQCASPSFPVNLPAIKPCELPLCDENTRYMSGDERIAFRRRAETNKWKIFKPTSRPHLVPAPCLSALLRAVSPAVTRESSGSSVTHVPADAGMEVWKELRNF